MLADVAAAAAAADVADAAVEDVVLLDVGGGLHLLCVCGVVWCSSMLRGELLGEGGEASGSVIMCVQLLA